MTSAAVISEAENAELRDRALARLFHENPFVQVLGVTLERRETDVVVTRMPYAPSLRNTSGAHHGGAVSAFADTAAATAVWNTQDFNKGNRMVTLTMTVQYLGAAPERDLIATARCTKRGRDVAFVEVRITDVDGAPVADALVNYRVTL